MVSQTSNSQEIMERAKRSSQERLTSATGRKCGDGIWCKVELVGKYINEYEIQRRGEYEGWTERDPRFDNHAGPSQDFIQKERAETKNTKVTCSHFYSFTPSCWLVLSLDCRLSLCKTTTTLGQSILFPEDLAVTGTCILRLRPIQYQGIRMSTRWSTEVDGDVEGRRRFLPVLSCS